MTAGPELAVGAIVVVDDRLLMVRRATMPAAGHWSVPGGRVERGEVMANAVVREVFEETGLEIFCGEVMDWVERIDDTHHFVIVNFRALLASDMTPTAGSDASEVAWIPLEDVSELPLVPGLLPFLAEHQIVDTIV